MQNFGYTSIQSVIVNTIFSTVLSSIILIALCLIYAIYINKNIKDN